MNRISFLLKQLLPLTYHSKYKTPDGAYISVWRQWFGCVWGAKHYKLAD